MILIDRIVTLRCRSPCGERGLKWANAVRRDTDNRSLPVRGAWVEISNPYHSRLTLPSLPVRGAWVEIGCSFVQRLLQLVAPRAGSVG